MVVRVSQSGEKVLTVEQIASLAGCDQRTVNQALRRGDLVSQETSSVRDWMIQRIAKERDPEVRKQMIHDGWTKPRPRGLASGGRTHGKFRQKGSS